MTFLRFMSSSTGRLVRVIAGAGLIALGLIGGGAWLAVSVVGLVPLLAGLFDVCAFAPFGHLPFAGQALRSDLLKK